jgi:hypothetical protein
MRLTLSMIFFIFQSADSNEQVQKHRSGADTSDPCLFFECVNALPPFSNIALIHDWLVRALVAGMAKFVCLMASCFLPLLIVDMLTNVNPDVSPNSKK